MNHQHVSCAIHTQLATEEGNEVMKRKIINMGSHLTPEDASHSQHADETGEAKEGGRHYNSCDWNWRRCASAASFSESV